MEQSKMITYILVFLLGFIISKIIPDICDKLYENSIIEKFIIGGQVDAVVECVSGTNEENCGACFGTTQNDDGSYTIDSSIPPLTRDACLAAGKNWFREITMEGGAINYSHGLECNSLTHQCDEPCLR